MTSRESRRTRGELSLVSRDGRGAGGRGQRVGEGGGEYDMRC